MTRRKRLEIVEYAPSTASSSNVPTLTGAITTHHTHYEPRRRPVKSVVTVDVQEDVQDEHVEVADTLLTIPPTLLDDDRIEEVECEGQELEMHGLGTEISIAEDISVDGGRKRRRTQGVSIGFFQKSILIKL